MIEFAIFLMIAEALNKVGEYLYLKAFQLTFAILLF